VTQFDCMLGEAVATPAVAVKDATTNDASALTEVSHKSVREYEVLASDRVSLAAAANNLVSTLVLRQISPLLYGSGVTTGELELTAPERATYDAALDYLRRQFSSGFRESESVQVRAESDVSNKFKR